MVPLVGGFITQHVQAIVGLLGFSFGVWKWWRFHDRVLHKRLREYLGQQDRRLTDARSYIVEALHKPGAERKFVEPLFSIRPLRRVLRRRNWTSLLGLTRLETSTERQLDKALRQLDHRLEAADRQFRTLRLQQASAHFLKGAIASARAGHSRTDAISHLMDRRALDSFRAALQVPGHEADLELLEFEAQQLMRLGYLDDASSRLQRLLDHLTSIQDSKKRDLLHARINRQRALIAQARAFGLFRAGVASGPGAMSAHQLLCQSNAEDTAIKLRLRYGPYEDWEALEQADLHYLCAFVCWNRGFKAQADSHLHAAESEYHRILNGRDSRNWLLSQANRRLRAAASKGLERVAEARKSPAIYDEAWLLPPLEPIERPAADKSQGRSEKAVEQASQKSDIDNVG